MAVFGATEEDLEAVRRVLSSRWPYPLTRDGVLEGCEEWWLFKVKRYPWSVSYGNKHADKAMEAAKELLARRQLQLSPPKNMDSDSAKSVLACLVKVSNSLCPMAVRRRNWHCRTSATWAGDFRPAQTSAPA